MEGHLWGEDQAEGAGRLDGGTSGRDAALGAYYYTGVERGPASTSDGQVKLRRFLDRLEETPGFFVSRLPRRLETHECPHCCQEIRFTREKEVDTTLVADMLRLAAVGAFDIAVLMCGDADSAPAVEGVRLLGKQVFVASWGGRGLAPRIRKAAFDHIDLSCGLSAFGDAVEDGSARGKPDEQGTRGEAEPERDEPAVSAEEAILRDLEAAQAHFGESGFVGAKYFVERWRSPHSRAEPQERQRILNRLVDAGRVEVYDSPSGDKALRIPPSTVADEDQSRS